ncbi:hypothetical protein MTR67_043578 [Solanum verrucosum]|uniref:Uncharacterized protein n=1 Tax=Solanum verrucosum TaxID=315347 RepID=A0AAF0ZUG3_SOLVR|nr:hypothetical protein MTR67_043578 [Solanum verrucosum]
MFLSSRSVLDIRHL